MELQLAVTLGRTKIMIKDIVIMVMTTVMGNGTSWLIT